MIGILGGPGIELIFLASGEYSVFQRMYNENPKRAILNRIKNSIISKCSTDFRCALE